MGVIALTTDDYTASDYTASEDAAPVFRDRLCGAKCLRFLNRAALLLLVLAVPALSTLAKTSWYLPQTNTGHYLTGAIKMKVSCSPVVMDRAPLRASLEPIPPQPRVETRREERIVPLRVRLSLTICLQHRSPPPLLG
jgi:hypothetical protein